MKTFIVCIFLGLLYSTSVLADAGVVRPLPSTTGGGGSGTIAVTSTFQQVFAAISSTPGTKLRTSCTIINNGTHTMWVAEGTNAASATTANSVPISPNQAYYCNNGLVILQGEIDITGTINDTFYAAQTK